jgi:hypothetical protein
MAASSDPPAWSRPRSGAGWHAGAVTRIGLPDAEPAVAPPPADPARADRRRLLLFGGTAAALLVTGLVVVLAMTMSGNVDPFWDRPSAPVDVRPPLARMCPAPTIATSPEPVPEAPPTAAPDPAEARTVDEESGISYKAYGAPWQPWNTVWRAGTLEVPYKVGQHIVTEIYSGGTYHASILSAAVPAADNDALALNLECVGRQVTADVRAEYYPQPNTMDPLRDELTTLGGRPAWVSEFRLHFSEAGLDAKDELSAVAVIDVGRPTAAVLYISIPGTHKQFDHVIDEVLTSVRPL